MQLSGLASRDIADARCNPVIFNLMMMDATEGENEIF
jgi:hypothetical protein